MVTYTHFTDSLFRSDGGIMTPDHTGGIYVGAIDVVIHHETMAAVDRSLQVALFCFLLTSHELPFTTLLLALLLSWTTCGVLFSG